MLNKKYVSLAITSEYLGAPASSYGHIFLVFHDNEEPELESLIIQFTATPDRSNLFNYLSKGLLGGFYGNYNIGFLFEKEHEYIKKEQRQIYYYRLRVSKKEKVKIIDFYENNKFTSYQYKFLSKNCASYINDLLVETIGAKKMTDTFVAPIEVLKNLNSFIINEKKQDPTAIILKNKFDSFSHKDKKAIKELVLNADENHFLAGHSFYGTYLNYDFLKNNQHKKFPKSNKIKLYPRVFSDNISHGPLQKQLIHQLFFEYTTDNIVNLGLSPSIMDIYTFQKDSLHESEITFLAPTLSIQNKKINLKNFRLINAKIYPSYDFITPKFSWEFDADLNKSKFRLGFAWGLSKKIYRSTLTALIGSFVQEKKINQKNNIYLKLQYINYFNVLGNQKVITSLVRSNRQRSLIKINLNSEIAQNFQLLTILEYQSKLNNLSLQLRYFF